MSRARGVVPILVVVRLPTSRHQLDPADVRLAEAAGLEVIDLTNAYGGYDEESLVQSRNDHHQNTLGHRIVGERLYDELLRLDARRAEPALRRAVP
jgi:hypothetical protein